LKKPLFFFLVFLIFAVFLALAWSSLPVAIQRNRLALQTARWMLSGAGLPEGDQFSSLAEDCRSSWLLGFVDNQGELRPTLNAHWQRAIQCNPQHVGSLSALYADDLDFARQVNAGQPESAEGWFWLAELIAAEQPQDALEYLRRGLALNPEDSHRWRLVGDLLTQEGDLPGALEAYLASCKTGDAGYNGCLRAGGTAEQMGDYAAAIRYYRMSYWPPAWERAERLEGLLQEQP
jgi:tetratricopeptide (TPR) repeat protein